MRRLLVASVVVLVAGVVLPVAFLGLVGGAGGSPDRRAVTPMQVKTKSPVVGLGVGGSVAFTTEKCGELGVWSPPSRHVTPITQEVVDFSSGLYDLVAVTTDSAVVWSAGGGTQPRVLGRLRRPRFAARRHVDVDPAGGE